MPKKGPKSILIRVFSEEEGIVVSIRDNGIGRAASGKMKANQTIQKQSIGISLSSDRLNFFNQSEKFNYYFEILDHDGNSVERGTEVVFHLRK
jgi:hypothetical protein